jgi:hypothetical protein
MFAELQSGKPQLGKNRTAVGASIEDLNKMLSVLHRLELALSAAINGADTAKTAIICRAIAQSAPGRKLTMLFDPRRNEERFRALLKKLSDSMELDIQLAVETISLLAEAEASILSEISSKERYLQLADLEAENIKAQESVLAGMELSVLYKLFAKPA